MKTKSELVQKLATLKQQFKQFAAEFPPTSVTTATAHGNFQGSISVLEWILKDDAQTRLRQELGDWDGLEALDDEAAQEWAEEHYTADGFPDFSRFDDLVRDAHGMTARDRAIERYHEQLDRRA